MKNSMKKWLCLILAIAMMACFVACSEDKEEKNSDAEKKISEYLNEHEEELTEKFAQGSNGMADVEFKADGSTVVMVMKFKTISSDMLKGKEDQITKTYDSMFEKMDLVKNMQQDIPEVEAVRLELSTSDGNEFYNKTFK